MRVNLNGIHELRLTLPGTTTGAIATPGVTSIVNAGFNGVNAQTGTSYTVQSSDNQKLLTLNNAAAVAVTLPQAGTTGIDGNFAFWVTNEGAGNATLTPVTSTIDGQPSITLNTGQGVVIFTDGTNYFSVKGMGTSGADTGGAGIAVSSIGALALSGTVYIPISGGGVSSATESDVVVAAPAGSTLSNLFVQLSAAPGAGNSVVFTVRKNGTDTGLTCTISDTATSASDTAHSVTVAQGDLLGISIVPSGTVSVTPNVLAASQWGLGADAISSLAGDVTAMGPGAATAQVVSTHLTAPLPVNQGGTGTATPSLVGGSNVTITGAWPNQTIAATGGGGGGSVSFGASPPAPAVVQAKTGPGSGLTFDYEVFSGDVIAVAYQSEDVITGSTVSDNLGTAYSLAGQISGHSVNLNVWVGVAPTKGTCTVTIGSPGTNFNRLGIMEIGGITATVDTTVTAYNGVSPASIDIATSIANDFIFAAVGGFHSVNVFSFGSDFTLSSQSNGSDANALGYCAAGDPGTYTLTVIYTGAGSDNSPIILVALKAATEPSGTEGSLYFATEFSPYQGFVYHLGAWHSF